MPPSSHLDVVSSAIARVSNLATLPGVAARIIKTADDPRAGVHDLAQVIEHAPDVATRLLRVVNSAFYGVPGQVTSLDRAVSMVGFAGVKNIAIAASLTRTFHGQPLSDTFAPKDLWAHSVAVGVASRAIANAGRAHAPDEAFLAGLIHDIGVMVEMQVDRAGLATVLKQLETEPSLDLLDVEAEVFGATHEAFGEALSDRWNLPGMLTQVVGRHHRPFDLPQSDRRLAVIVHVADQLVLRAQPGFILDSRTSDFPDAVLDEIQLTHDQFAAIEAGLPATIESAGAFLS